LKEQQIRLDYRELMKLQIEPRLAFASVVVWPLVAQKLNSTIGIVRMRRKEVTWLVMSTLHYYDVQPICAHIMSLPWRARKEIQSASAIC